MTGTDTPVEGMSSNRPYLVRALYEWIADNGLTPYVLVNAELDGVQVPARFLNNGKVILNLAPRAISNLDLGNEWIQFSARFSGKSEQISLPTDAVIAIYAQENGQGMMFAEESDSETLSAEVNKDDDGDKTPPDSPDGAKSRHRGSHLKVVK